MPPRTKLCMLDRGRALGWLQDGVSGREFGRRLGVSQSVIQRLQARFQATGSAAEHPRSGRPKCTNMQDDRYLHLLALRNRTITRRSLVGNLRAAANSTVSRRTVSRRLRAFNLYFILLQMFCPKSISKSIYLVTPLAQPFVSGSGTCKNFSEIDMTDSRAVRTPFNGFSIKWRRFFQRELCSGMRVRI